MRGRVGRLVQVDNTGPKHNNRDEWVSINIPAGNLLDICGDITLQRTTARRNRGEMGRTDEQLVVVFEQEGPLRSVQSGLRRLRFDRKVTADLCGRNLSARELAGGGHDGDGE